MKTLRRKWIIPATLFATFILWTAAVCHVNIQAIGPLGSSVGLAEINLFVHRCTGVHFTLHTITDYLSLIPIGVCMGFGALMLVQWIQRKSLWKVDRSLLALSGFYIAVMAAYVFFEIFAINYRPVLINGILEASYPSSTTMLVMCVMPTAHMQMKTRIKSEFFKKGLKILILVFTVFMVLGRLISGVHWFSDIVGGALLSSALVSMYSLISGIQ